MSDAALSKVRVWLLVQLSLLALALWGWGLESDRRLVGAGLLLSLMGCVAALIYTFYGARDHEPVPPSSGTTLDQDYERLERLAAGQMGEVWRARHRTLGRDCAIKQVRAEGITDQLKGRFLREARVTAQLRSPHTVAVHDFGVLADGSLYYVMEHLHGIDLQSCVSRFGRMPVERVVHILLQACHSLEEAHRLGLVHRDLKPSNIMLCRHGIDFDVVKVVDFGLAKEQDTERKGPKLTAASTVLGTAAYLAPESLKGSAFVDARADIYALGCIGFWLLTGQLLFNHDQPIKMAKAHASEQPPRVRDIVSESPAELDELLSWCLQKSPEHRPASAAVLADHLRQIPLPEVWTQTHAEAWHSQHADGQASAFRVSE